MAVHLLTARNTFLQAVRDFPRWMSIRKRPEKSTSGLYFQALVEEQTDIIKELNKFIDEFFLLTYVGKETTLPDYVYIVKVGSVLLDKISLKKPSSLKLTIDGKTFLNSMDDYCLYQDGYFIISPNNLPQDKKLNYEYNGYLYGGVLERYHIWNIIDEFAMFLGLERFTDAQETNAQLLKRCFLVFSNPTNSTCVGLQNTIMNCVSNDVTIEREDIRIEIPDDQNVWISDKEYGTFYERFAWLNRDILRTKVFDISQWEHNYKKLDYLSHQWDKPLETYQDGVGQTGDLSVSLSSDYGDTTDVTVVGYKQDLVTLNSYFRKERYRNIVNFDLVQYKNNIQPFYVQYKIEATPATLIDVSNIWLREENKKIGIDSYKLQNLVTDAAGATVTKTGTITPGTYRITLRSPDDYSDMETNKISLVSGSTTTSYMKEKGNFQINGGVMTVKTVKRHAVRVSELKTYSNLEDVPEGGFTIPQKKNQGTFTLDVTGCGNSVLKIESYGTMFDIIEQTSLWTLNGLQLNTDTRILYTTTVEEDNGQAVLEMDCMAYGYTLAPGNDAQGSMKVTVIINGETNTTLSQTLTTPNVPVEHRFDRLTHVKIVFQKVGNYPVAVKDIKASKYDITYSLTVGKVVETPMYLMLPDVSDKKLNTLTVNITSFDVENPVIKYVHVGATTARTSYTTEDIVVTDSNSYLDIDTVCKVSLYKKNNNNKFTLVNNNYDTSWSYKNNTENDIYLTLDLSIFSGVPVCKNNKTIHSTVSGGVTTYYVTLYPGEELTSLVLQGVSFKGRSFKTIQNLLGISGDYNVYAAYGAKGFIVRNPTTNEEWYQTIKRTSLTAADTFTYEGLPADIQGVFVVDKAEDVIVYDNYTDRNFEETYLSVPYDRTQTYVAYNGDEYYKSVVGITENIIIQNTFQPILTNLNSLFLYRISPVVSTDTAVSPTVIFKKLRNNVTNYYYLSPDCRAAVVYLYQMLEQNAAIGDIQAKISEINNSFNLSLTYNDELYDILTERLYGGDWSLGQKELVITADLDFNNLNVYEASVVETNGVYEISNVIPLTDTVVVGAETLTLAEYQVVPKGNLEVIYGTVKDHIETGYVIDQPFYKLKYCNVVKNGFQVVINSTVYSSSNYEIMEDEGIICWKSVESIAGDTVQFAYYYKVPTALRYTSLKDLYDMIGLKLEAYLQVPVISKIPKKLLSSDSFIVEFEEAVDYVPRPKCTNPNFLATYANGVITVNKVYTDNVALIQAGYYYDNDKEYYFYNHRKTKEVDWYSNVTFHNVKKLDLIFQFIMASSNYLLHTDFAAGKNFKTLCYVDFVDKRIETAGISNLGFITACESFNMWQSFNMTISLVTGVNGAGLLFSPDNSSGYGILDITDYLIPGGIFSLFITNSITLQLYREIKTEEDDSFVKSVFAEPFANFTVENNFSGYQIPKDLDTGYRYFLVVRGNGVVDDIVSRAGISISNQAALHIKNIDNFGFNVSEKVVPGYIQKLLFDKDKCALSTLEISKDNTIRSAANVDYGLTKIFSTDLKYDQCLSSSTVARQKQTFVTTDSSGTVSTPRFFVDNYSNGIEFYVKINSLVVGEMANFTVKAYGAADERKEAQLLNVRTKTNLAKFLYNRSLPYLEIQIDMAAKKTIESIEVYMRYGELNYQPLVIDDYYGGWLTTKVYDVITSANYKVTGIEGEVNGDWTLEVRGCRKDVRYMVWTEWYPVELDYDLMFKEGTTPHVFSDYRFFQFRITLNNPLTKVKINNFILQAVV